MYLRDVVIESLETGRAIYRKSCLHGEADRSVLIKPTNSYDCCQIIVVDCGKARGSRNWNPTADDLLADDWEIIKE